MDNYWTTMGQLWDNYWITIIVDSIDEIGDFYLFGKKDRSWLIWFGRWLSWFGRWLIWNDRWLSWIGRWLSWS